MKKPLSQLKAFFDQAEERKLSGSDQLLYLHLFNKFNTARWPETLQVSDKAMLESMRLYDSDGKPATVRTLRRARQRLQAKGFIEYKAGSGDEFTEYQLINLLESFKTVNGNEVDPVPSPVQTPEDTSASSYKHACDKDVKDVKTSSINQSRARARESIKTVNSQEVLKAWREAKGYGEGFALIDLENEYGTEAILAALEVAKNQNNNPKRLYFNFFKSVLLRIQSGNAYESQNRKRYEKGGETNEHDNGLEGRAEKARGGKLCQNRKYQNRKRYDEIGVPSWLQNR